MKSLVEEMGFKRVDYVRVSAHNEKGIDELRNCLAKVEPKPREPDEPLFLPIDHAFKVKGHGTVVTGTILGGRLKAGQKITIEPITASGKVRSIQMFGEQRESAKSGDRVGLNVPDINHNEIFRGCYITEDPSLHITSKLFVKLSLNPYYKGRVTKKMVLSATIGMPTVTAEIVPVEVANSQYISLKETQSNDFECIILMNQRLAIRSGMKVLLMRTDLPPTVMRILASGHIIKALTDERIFNRKQRIGKIYRIRENDVLVDGLASSQEIAKQIVGKTISTESKNQGVITGTFGTRGVVSATFNKPVTLDEPVIYERLVEEVYAFGS
jgi:selenocysteine-specific elongation factor